MPPVGNRMDDGYSCTISCTSRPNIAFWEKSIKPPGVDAGGKIDTTTMRNIRYRTFKGKALITLTSMTVKVAYDPAVIDDIIAIAGVNQQWTVVFPDAADEVFWGILDKFEPDDLVEGSQPEATITIEPTNQDNSEVEQAIDYIAP